MYLLLGNASDLGFAEVTELAKQLNVSVPQRLGQRFSTFDDSIDPQKLIQISGGIVKIYQALSIENADEINAIADDMVNDHEVHFAISSIEKQTPLKNTAADIKKALQARGVKPHFRILDNILNTAGIVSKSNEYLISENTELPQVLKAVAAQDLYHWSAKDYDRPAVDPHSGMLPPKIARMMMNIGLPNVTNSQTVVYDPFCGSGTIMVEALDRGFIALGSDISSKAVQNTEKNCSWFTKNFDQKGQFKIFEADVNHLNPALIRGPVDSIIFEGYLGPADPIETKIPNLVKGLEKMYRGVFKHLYPFLKPNGKLVCALPEFKMTNGMMNLDKVVDWATTLGYTRCGRYEYGRPKAVVKRAIYVLQKGQA